MHTRNSMFGRAWLLGTAAIVAAEVLLTASGVSAQTVPTRTAKTDRQSHGLEQIVVTARRRSESLQKVPVSVGVLPAATLKARQINNINDLKAVVAGLSTSRTGVAGNGYYAIRGEINNSLPTPASDPGIGFYIDGVYIARGQGAGTAIPDIAQVEVDRGPQGTLFGRNSAGGAINFITHAPTNQYTANADVLYGNYNHVTSHVMANFPVSNDLAIRLSYVHDSIDGDVNNTNGGPGYNVAGFGSFKPVKNYGASDDDSFSVRARYTGIENLTLDYKFDYGHLIETPLSDQLLGFLPSPFLPTLAAILPYQKPGSVVQSFTRLGSVDEDFTGPSDIVNTGNLLNATYNINDQLTAKSITAYRTSQSSSYLNLAGSTFTLPIPPTYATPFCVSCSANKLRQDEFSEEGQLIGTYGRVNFILGAFVFREHADFRDTYADGRITPAAPGIYIPVQSAFSGAGLGDFTVGDIGSYINSSYAGYGHVDVALLKGLKLAAGFRDTEDHRVSQDLRIFSLNTKKVIFNQPTYDVALNYNIDPTKMVYAKWATGYVSGGTYASIPFQPETDRQVELGFKGQFLNNRLRFNSDVYYTWIKNIQLGEPSVNPEFNPVLAASGYSTPYPLGILIYNAKGNTTIWGYEAEASYTPIDGLLLSANYAYNFPHYADDELPRSPKINFSFSGEYSFPSFENGSHVAFLLNGDYRGAYYGTGLNLGGDFVGDVPAALRPGYSTSAAYLAAFEKGTVAGDYWLINARLSLAEIPIGHATGTVSAFVNNIGNSSGLLYAASYGATVGGAFERPRTYGMQLTINY